jgi:ribosomal protein S18 acetylase RimI-like enzyme
MDFTLRRAGPGDLDTVMALETAGFVPGIVEDREVFARRISAFPAGFLLAETPSDGAVGYFNAEVWSRWDPLDGAAGGRFDLGHDVGAFLDPDGEALYVASMTVAPAFRGAGVGRLLFRRGLDRMVAEFPRLRTAVLIVNEHWTGARKIYQGEGFHEAGWLPRFFRPEGGPEGDAVLMTCRLRA